MPKQFKLIINGGKISNIFDDENDYYQLIQLNNKLNIESKELTKRGLSIIKKLDKLFS